MNRRKEIVPNDLREYRLRVGLRQKDVAGILGFCSEERICHWEKGKNIPNLINLFKLSSLYRVTPMELYSELIESTKHQIEEKINSGTVDKPF